jgi:hypothetical protein
MAILERASRSFQRWAEWAEHGRLKANCQRQEEEEEGKHFFAYFIMLCHSIQAKIINDHFLII